jgi:hypothetical protein
MGNKITGNGYITSLTFFTEPGLLNLQGIKSVLGTYSSGDTSQQTVPNFRPESGQSKTVELKNGFDKLEYWAELEYVSSIKFYRNNQLVGSYYFADTEPTGPPKNILTVSPGELVREITLNMKGNKLASIDLLSGIKIDPQTIITHIVPVDTTPVQDNRMMIYHLIIAILSVLIGVVIGRYTAKCEQKAIVYPANTAIQVRQA